MRFVEASAPLRHGEGSAALSCTSRHRQCCEHHTRNVAHAHALAPAPALALGARRPEAQNMWVYGNEFEGRCKDLIRRIDLSGMHVVTGGAFFGDYLPIFSEAARVRLRSAA